MNSTLEPRAANNDLAFVLTGGGARGAYQVGVLRWLARKPTPPDRVGFVGAVHAEIAQRTNWRTSISGIAGLTLHSARRAGRLVVRYHTGPSRMGEFFLTPERTIGLELVFDW